MRVKVAFMILFRPNSSWFICMMNRDELKNQIKGHPYDVSVIYHRLHHMNVIDVSLVISDGWTRETVWNSFMAEYEETKTGTSKESLERQLSDAIENEEYERAAIIRNSLNKLNV